LGQAQGNLGLSPRGGFSNVIGRYEFNGRLTKGLAISNGREPFCFRRDKRLTKSFRNSKLHIRATMLLQIKGNLWKATMLFENNLG